MDATDLEQCGRLLELLKKYSPRTTRRRTLLELGGYPHLENVASNILQFYLSPDEPHGFGRIVLESLAALVRGHDDNFEMGEVSTVEREQTTGGTKKRIDILITSENAIVGIENKITQPVYNDLREYMKFLKRSSREHQKTIGILLAVQNTDPKVQLEGFHWITYYRFFQEIFQRIPNQLASIDTQYLNDFVVFAKTLLTMSAGNQMLDKQVLKLVQEHENEFEQLFTIGDSVRGDMTEKLRLLAASTDPRGATENGIFKVSGSLLCGRWIKVANIMPDLTLIIDVIICPSTVNLF